MNLLNKLFRNKYAKAEIPTINSIQFNTSAWKPERHSRKNKVWLNEAGDVLSLNLVKDLTDIPSFSDLAGIRNFCRQLATGGGKVGGIISVDIVKLQHILALKTIY